MLLTEALESRAYLDQEKLAFLADNGDIIFPAQASQEIPSLAAFQTDDLDAFDSDCDDAPSAKARKVPALYNGHTIVKRHDALSVPDTEETAMVAGFLWEIMGKVMGSSWSVEEWQEEWGEAVAGLAGMGMNNVGLNVGGRQGLA
nr:hypothetical protein [Tanacetum cinerariifolium]